MKDAATFHTRPPTVLPLFDDDCRQLIRLHSYLSTHPALLRSPVALRLPSPCRHSMQQSRRLRPSAARSCLLLFRLYHTLFASVRVCSFLRVRGRGEKGGSRLH